ncbi:uncharacterized protein [Dermacentor albipictus]|uniref:uncharacterized protein n=1 Tax=Dermacentor albipictus TaxID=60249 RepID=UPI0038FC8EBA
MARYRCALIWLGLTVGEVWSNASTLPDGASGRSALSAGGNGTRPELGVQATRGSHSGLLVLRRSFQDSVAAYKRRFSTPSTSGGDPSASAPTSRPRVPFGFTRDPVCNMSAFLKQARVCWKEAAVYSDKPEGICAHKVDAMFRRCLVRVTKLSSCEDDERAKQRIRGEVDSQRAHCVGASPHRAAAVCLVAPRAAHWLLAGATLLALCGLSAN